MIYFAVAFATAEIHYIIGDKKMYVIYSIVEDEILFWSNKWGWGSLEGAVEFAYDCIKDVVLPTNRPYNVGITSIEIAKICDLFFNE